MTKRAAIYARISQDREGAGLGVERQRADCTALASKLGWAIVAEYTDNDMSAYSGKRRPGYRQLLEDIDSGKVDAVLVWHTDRLHRSPRELEEYVDICERRKIVTQTVKAGELDLSTPSGRAIARTLGAWARFEVEHKSERTKRAQLQAMQAGRWTGGARPFGWTLRADGSAVLNPAEAREVRRASARLLAGASLGSIVTDLNERGVTTSTGRPWNYTSLRQVLTRARNAGLITLHGDIVGQSTWATLVSEDTWRSVCALLTNPDRRRSTSNRVRWLMAGLALCGTCNARMKSASVRTSAGGGATRTVYRCPTRGSGHVARAAADVDLYVQQVVIERLSRPDAAEVLAAGSPQHDLADARAEAVALRARMIEAAESFADGVITVAQLAQINDRLRSRLAEMEQAMLQSAQVSAVAAMVGARGGPASAWAAMPVDQRRSIVDALLVVTVLPSGRRGRGFDPALLRVEWREQA